MALRITPGILYRSDAIGIVYAHQVEKYAFDIMDAVDVPHANRSKFSLVVPQEIYTATSKSTVERREAKIIITTIRTSGKLKGAVGSGRLHASMG